LGTTEAETVLLLAERAYVRRRDGATFLVRPADRAESRLNPVAAAIVEGLAAPTTVDALRARVSARFDVDDQECARAVDGFVADLERLGVVERFDAPAAPPPLRRSYLDLLKRTLVNLVYPEDAVRIDSALGGTVNGDIRLLRDVRYARPDVYDEVVASKLEGGVDPFAGTKFAHTMIGLSGLDNLERCAHRVFADGVQGDFLEAGVCYGGASIFMRALQVAYGEEERATWLADTFAGVPPPTHEVDREHELDLTEERVPWMAASLETVRDNFATYDLLSDQVRFLPGLFADTLPGAPVERLAILRVDGDLYSSTRDALDALYDRVSDGGYVIVDDYGCLDPCRIAVDDFIAERGLDVELHQVDWTRVCWRKSG
jgi:Macrocin-O-methyltransferase (TylF)/Coenzyme PQQ synthesis protein D (PqqD)